MNLIRSRSAAWAIAGLLLLTFLLYLPGLRGNFIFDDYANIVDNSKVHMTRFDLEQLATAWGSGVASSLQRPLSMLSFALNHLFTEMDPYAFKLTNLLIHLLTTLSVYLLVRELARAVHKPDDSRATELFALLVTACWALHPLNVSTVLYVVQRMTQLAMLMTVLALYLYCRWRQTPIATPLRAFVLMGCLALLTTLGILGKENAVLTPLLMLFIECFVFRFRVTTDGDRWLLRLLVLGGLILPVLGVVALLLFDPAQLIGDYSVRTFTMTERVLTQTRVLWSYIGWLLLPTSGALSFFHDDYVLSRSLLDPPTTLLAIASLAALLALVWRLRLSRPLTSLGLAFFLVGHLLESTVVSLELVFEHRNYLPGLGILLALADTLAKLPETYFQASSKKAVAAMFAVFLGLGCSMEARKWSNTFEHVRQIAVAQPDSHRANYMLGMLYNLSAAYVDDSQESLRRARDHFLISIPLDPIAVRGHLGYVLTQSALGEELDPRIMQEMARRLETSQLMRDGFSEISRITHCWYSGQCRFPLDQLVQMYNAIGRNQSVDPIIVQGILDQVGSAMVANFNRPNDGRALLYLARSKREDVTLIDLKLIQLEVQLGNRAAAEKLLEEALAKNPEYFKEELAGMKAAFARDMDTQ